MHAGIFMLVLIGSITGLTLGTHYFVHGTINWVYVLLAMFLSLNLFVCYLEWILLFCEKLIAADSQALYRDYTNNKRKPMAKFMYARVGVRELFTPSFWVRAWSAYAMFDGSYSDKRTFGYAADVGNGLSTLIPSLIVHLGLTWHFLSPRVLGIIALMMFYQMVYGTVIYWLSFRINDRHKLLTRRENLHFILGCNVPWFALGSVGIYAAIRMILDNSYAVIGIG